MRLPISRIEWQRTIVISVIFGAIVISLLLAIYRWPNLPYHRKPEFEQYAERIDLLKYFVSLACSGIVATWWVVCNSKPNHHIYRISINSMSWAWTFLGVSVLSAIVEIYQTYKDQFYRPLTTVDEFANIAHQFYHSVSIHILQATYFVTDFFFFLGWVVLILALVGTGQKNGPTAETAESPKCDP